MINLYVKRWFYTHHPVFSASFISIESKHTYLSGPDSGGELLI